jgi:hypothetical protein
MTPLSEEAKKQVRALVESVLADGSGLGHASLVGPAVKIIMVRGPSHDLEDEPVPEEVALAVWGALDRILQGLFEDLKEHAPGDALDLQNTVEAIENEDILADEGGG